MGVGEPEMRGGGRGGGGGGDFIMGGWEIFKASLHSWQRSANLFLL